MKTADFAVESYLKQTPKLVNKKQLEAWLGTDSGLDSAHLGSARGFILSSVCFGSALARGSIRAGLVRTIENYN